VQVDFSPKGGPADLNGTCSEAGIRWAVPGSPDEGWAKVKVPCAKPKMYACVSGQCQEVSSGGGDRTACELTCS